jgi:hypothetical protein
MVHRIWELCGFDRLAAARMVWEPPA